MSARVDASGKVAQLGSRAESDQSITEDDVQRPKLLVRALQKLAADVAELRRRFAPKRVTFPPRAVDATGTTKYRFMHGLGSIPEILVVRWDGAAAPNFAVDRSSDKLTLVLVSKSAGTATIRLEEPG